MSEQITHEVDIDVKPEYHLTTTVQGRQIDLMKPLDDPFVMTRITIGWRDVLKALVRSLVFREYRSGLRVTVDVGGNWDALKHVMTLRPIRSVLTDEQFAAAQVADAFEGPGDELELRRNRDAPHTIWYWVDDPNDPIPAPHAVTLDTADEAEAFAKALLANEMEACEKAGTETNLAWIRVFRSDNEAYETYRWERSKGDGR